MKSASIRLLVMRIISLFPAALVASALGPSPAMAETVVTDGFDDGNRTGTPDGIDWYTHSHGNNALGISIVDDSAGLGSGNALRVEPITTGQSIMGVFGSPLSVPAEIGSKLTLRFEIRNDFGAPVPGTFRFGLYDADEANFPDPAGFGGMDGDWDAATPGSQFDPGVFVQQDNAASLTCCPPSATRLREESGAFGTQFGGGDERNVAQPPGAFPGFDEADGKNILTLEVERLAAGIDAGALRYTYTIDNGTATDSLSGLKLGTEFIDPPTTDTYDYVSMFYDGVSEGAARWLIDNVTIDIDTIGPGFTADFDEDGDVDGDDFLLWQTGFPTPENAVKMDGDADADGDVDGDDFLIWQTQFPSPRSGSLGTAAVPEPGGLVLLLVVSGAWFVRRARDKGARLGCCSSTYFVR